MKLNILKKHFPRKKFSQNFLVDKNIIQKIISIINPKINQILIEIGPGLAALTKPMCEFLDNLIVIEIDPYLVELLKKNYFYYKLTVFYQDALTFNYINLFENKKKLIRVFGNLPYNISTALLIHLFKQIKVIKDMNFMLQKEVADRLIASPGCKSYGRLSIITQYYCNVKILLNIPSKCFIPVPKVNSVFVTLTPYLNNPYSSYDVNTLSYITKKAFQKRRKMIRQSLKDLFTEKVLIKLGIDPRLRAENVTILEYCQLSNYFFNQ